MICAKCNELKNDSDFSYKNKKLGTKQSYCKNCQRSYGRKHYDTNKQYYIDKSDKYQKTSATLVLDYLRSHPCVDCGEKDVEVLDFDHLRDKTSSVCRMILSNKSPKLIFEEIAKCAVRCANCHRRKTAREQGWFKISEKL